MCDDVAALLRQRLDEEAAHRVVADPRDQRRLQAEPRAAERGVGRRAAEILGEASDVLEARADLLRVEVDGEAAEADDVERAAFGEARRFCMRVIMQFPEPRRLAASAATCVTAARVKLAVCARSVLRGATSR